MSIGVSARLVVLDVPPQASAIAFPSGLDLPRFGGQFIVLVS
jgi:hypothetical protein